MYSANVMATYLLDVGYLVYELSESGTKGKALKCAKIESIHLLGSMNVFSKFNGNLLIMI